MTTPIKISELPAWEGDTSMCLHVSNAGQSQKLAISDIASLGVPGTGLVTGDIILRPTGVYPGLLKADGAVYDVSEHPGLFYVLADRLDSKYQIYDLEYLSRINLEGLDSSKAIVDACFFGERIAAVSADGSAGLFNLDGSLASNIVNLGTGGSSLDKFYKVFATANAVYFKKTSTSQLYVFDKIAGEIVEVGNIVVSRDYVPISVSLVEDVFLTTPGSGRLGVSVFNVEQMAFTQLDKVTENLGVGALFVQWDGGVWTQKETGSRDFCKIVDLLTTPRLAEEVVLNPEPGVGVTSYTGGSDYMYFQIDVSGVNWKLDTANNKFEAVSEFHESTGYTRLIPFLNAAVRSDTSLDDLDAVALSLISYDFCETWQQLPDFSGSRIVSLSDTYALQAGKMTTAGAPDGSSGNVQLCRMQLNDSQKFRVPNLTSNITGFSYYIKA
ncbi:hypothetical protein NOV18_08680 [Pseudomonas asiatica]|uniref:Uncharacterized protein n=1 Tax=Pseudomonas asiatica TaxID=2219225 RepID=A0AAJ5HX17_9PSED|nr:hypothetical protein [Pseudomonas asiatica]UUC20539.1 hypothetical protein NOV18_08680 [Pseudomonas asiatica]